MVGCGGFFGLQRHDLHFAVCAIAGVNFFLFGYDQGSIGHFLTLPTWIKCFPEINAHDNPDLSAKLGITVASYNVGCFLGAIMTLFIGDMYGRKRMVFYGSAIIIFGAILQCSAFNVWQLIVGRLVVGFGNGINTSTVPTWVSELSMPHIRGRMIAIQGTMVFGGSTIAGWIALLCGIKAHADSSFSWRFPIAFQIIFALILVGLIHELPESPHWLILKGNGKLNEANEVIAALAGVQLDDPQVNATYREIKGPVLEVKEHGWPELFTMGPSRHFHRVVLACIIQVLQQMSGIALFTYAATNIYSSVGYGAILARQLAAANATLCFFLSGLAVFFIESIGRRFLMLLCSYGMFLSMIGLTVLGYNIEELEDSSGVIVFISFTFSFTAFFAVGWSGIPWLYSAEIVPLRIRAPANGLSTALNWAFGLLVIMITPVSFSTIRYKTYLVFSMINLFIIPVVYFFYPDTSYRSLGEIDTLFLESQRGWRGWFDIRKKAKQQPHKYGKRGELLANGEMNTLNGDGRSNEEGASNGDESSKDDEPGEGPPEADGEMNSWDDSSKDEEPEERPQMPPPELPRLGSEVFQSESSSGEGDLPSELHEERVPGRRDGIVGWPRGSAGEGERPSEVRVERRVVNYREAVVAGERIRIPSEIIDISHTVPSSEN